MSNTTVMSVGNEGFTVPSLACFGSTPTRTFEIPAVVSDLSGVSYSPQTNTFFAVNNGDAKAYELTAETFTKIQEWDLEAKGVKDPETISVMDGRKVAVTDENPAHVYTMTLETGGTITGFTRETAVEVPAGNNLGFEGATWLKQAQRFIAVIEKNPTRIVSVNATDGSVTDVAANLEQSAGIGSVGALTRGGDSQDDVFIIAKSPQEQKGIHRVRLSDGKIMDKYAGAVCDMSQPEGLTFYKKGSDVYMLVVGEPTEARLFKAALGCTDALNSTTGLLQQCEEKVLSKPKCEKTFADGGCDYTRCDKSITDHTKICVEGATCTREECFEHCKNSNFSAPHESKTCTHWAWDRFESECYIFSGCEAEAFDNEYTLYAMVDETCEKTLKDAPKGCEKRTCNHASGSNASAKVCETGATACTVAECETKCKNHAGFTCEFYAYDAATSECVVFESCADEKDSSNYNLYVKVDPTCDKDLEDGGCTQRRCNKDYTKHDKICTDSTPEDQCTFDECRAKCANYTAWGTKPEDWCTYYAYDVADKECYLFNGCVGEAFDDDYTLYTMGYEERQAVKNTNTTSAPTETSAPTTPAPTSASGASMTSVNALLCMGLAMRLAF